jgi:predicted anti-sigma-YlaC factor YlaD
MMMWTRHVSRELTALLDGELPEREAQQAELHIEGCARCRAEYEQVKFGMATLERLQSIKVPESIWTAIDAELNATRTHARSTAYPWRWALAGTVAVALLSAIAWHLVSPSGTHWQVRRLEGSPAVDARRMSGLAQVGAGESIETDSTSRAAVRVGEIGWVEISPNTRVRIVSARPDEHRLALVRGEIRASISAPPRLFFVDTAAGTAVDLGCEYVLNSDEEGAGLLRVTKGWVAFQWNGVESLVPAGASCPTRPHAAPGIPYFDDATGRMKEALTAFASGTADENALSVVLAESRPRDTLTLWHVLSRVDVRDRAGVYDRIAALTPVPAGVSRDKALQLDPETLKRWREELAWTW